MERKRVITSFSPSMDIQVSSNFERLLYIINELDTAKVKQQMLDFKNEGKFEITKEQLLNINKLFAAYKITDEETLTIIKSVYQDYDYLLDPHSAIGYGALQKAIDNNIIQDSSTIISLACAHPAKFPGVIKKSINSSPKTPSKLEKIMASEEHFEVIEANLSKVQEFVKSKMRCQ
jgi:threonine synthase